MSKFSRTTLHGRDMASPRGRCYWPDGRGEGFGAQLSGTPDAREKANLTAGYEVQAKIIREKTARLKALRLAKEASEKKNTDA